MMEISMLSKYNRYGLEIVQNTDTAFTIKNKAGETFVADFKTSTDIDLMHWNYLAVHGKMHHQGHFYNIPDMLKDVFYHGNRLFKPQKKQRIDHLFDLIEGKTDAKMSGLRMAR